MGFASRGKIRSRSRHFSSKANLPSFPVAFARATKTFSQVVSSLAPRTIRSTPSTQTLRSSIAEVTWNRWFHPRIQFPCHLQQRSFVVKTSAVIEFDQNCRYRFHFRSSCLNYSIQTLSPAFLQTDGTCFWESVLKVPYTRHTWKFRSSSADVSTCVNRTINACVNCSADKKQIVYFCVYQSTKLFECER